MKYFLCNIYIWHYCLWTSASCGVNSDCDETSGQDKTKTPPEILEGLDRCKGRLSMTDEQEKFIRVYKYVTQSELIRRRTSESNGLKETVFGTEHQYPLIQCLEDLEDMLERERRFCPKDPGSCPNHVLRGVHTDMIDYDPEEIMKQLKDFDDRLRNEKRKNQHQPDKRPSPGYKTLIRKSRAATQTEKC